MWSSNGHDGGELEFRTPMFTPDHYPPLSYSSGRQFSGLFMRRCFISPMHGVRRVRRALGPRTLTSASLNSWSRTSPRCLHLYSRPVGFLSCHNFLEDTLPVHSWSRTAPSNLRVQKRFLRVQSIYGAFPADVSCRCFLQMISGEWGRPRNGHGEFATPMLAPSILRVQRTACACGMLPTDGSCTCCCRWFLQTFPAQVAI